MKTHLYFYKNIVFLTDDEFQMSDQTTGGNKRISKNSFSAPQPKTQTPIVLIVEDDADSRLMLRLLLETWRYRVVEAANGIEALNLTGKESPDLILMDIKMPLLDGFETTRHLRASGKSDCVPIVFLSACAEETHRRAAFAAGASEYLLKPLDFERLEKVLDRYTGKQYATLITKKLKLSESLTTVGSETQPILERIAHGERDAARECVEAYGNLVWALTKKFTRSRAEAEDLAAKIFLSIWQYAANFNRSELSEGDFIRLVVFRELNKRRMQIAEELRHKSISAPII